MDITQFRPLALRNLAVLFGLTRRFLRLSASGWTGGKRLGAANDNGQHIWTRI